MLWGWNKWSEPFQALFCFGVVTFHQGKTRASTTLIFKWTYSTILQRMKISCLGNLNTPWGEYCTIVISLLHQVIHPKWNVILYLKAIKASPCSPPTMWTPPSGMDRPRKKFRMSIALADHGRFCSRIMTLMLAADDASACSSQSYKRRKISFDIAFRTT